MVDEFLIHLETGMTEVIIGLFQIEREAATSVTLPDSVISPATNPNESQQEMGVVSFVQWATNPRV